MVMSFMVYGEKNLKGPKHEIFGSRTFMQSKPVRGRRLRN
jgi:hypothetical protein